MNRLLFLCLLLSFLLGCSIATRPNVSVVYQIPALKVQLPPLNDKSQLTTQQRLPLATQKLFQRLYALDPILALEFGKIPEFQGQIEENQVLVLKKFIDLVANATRGEKITLFEFLKVGYPEVRRYCTPLQAIFWALEKGAEIPLEVTYGKKTFTGVQNLIPLLSRVWDYSEKDRWNDYKIVTERLNSPELIDYYEQQRFIYEHRADHVGQPHSLFKTNRGQCVDVTDFSVYCLKKAGFKAYVYHVPSPSGYRYHAVTLFEVGGKEYIMDNGRPDKRGIVPKTQYNPI